MKLWPNQNSSGTHQLRNAVPKGSKKGRHDTMRTSYLIPRRQSGWWSWSGCIARCPDRKANRTSCDTGGGWNQTPAAELGSGFSSSPSPCTPPCSPAAGWGRTPSPACTPGYSGNASGGAAALCRRRSLGFSRRSRRCSGPPSTVTAFVGTDWCRTVPGGSVPMELPYPGVHSARIDSVPVHRHSLRQSCEGKPLARLCPSAVALVLQLRFLFTHKQTHTHTLRICVSWRGHTTGWGGVTWPWGTAAASVPRWLQGPDPATGWWTPPASENGCHSCTGTKDIQIY